jgi:hypothetical protein
MATRIFRVSIPGSLELAFNFVADCVSSAGLMIRNPETGRVTSWSDEGEQIVTAQEELLKKINLDRLKTCSFGVHLARTCLCRGAEMVVEIFFCFILMGLTLVTPWQWHLNSLKDYLRNTRARTSLGMPLL